MSDDLLDRATRALRTTTAEPELRSGLTRARLLESAQRRRGGWGGSMARVGFALAAVLFAGTALARFAPELPQIWHSFFAPAVEPASRPAAAPPAGAKRTARAKPSVTPPEEPPTLEPIEPAAVPVAAEPVAAEPAAAAEPATKPRARRVPRRATKASPSVEEVAPEPAELALFRRAQRLHLARDPGALGAWDDYLRVVEHGVLVPEARYNRALCLVRLGRGEEARAALEPFARGTYGDYRRSEAHALLAAMADAGAIP